MIVELNHTGYQSADLLPPFEFEGHEGKDVGDREQQKPGDVEGDGVIDPSIGPAIQTVSASRTLCRTPDGQGLRPQKKPALVTLY